MPQTHQQHRSPLLSRRETYTAITDATYTAKAGDQVIGVNRAGVVTVTLPTAEVRPGRIYTVKDESGNASSNNITVATEGSETIDGSATHVIIVDYQGVGYYSDGSNWFISSAAPDTQITLATTVSTQAHGDSAAGGSASTASKGDHKHAMPAQGGPTQADQTAVEGETNADNFTPTDLLRHMPGAAKVYVLITGAGAINSSISYNVASLTDTGTGDRTVVIADDFSTANYGMAWAGMQQSPSLSRHDSNERAVGSYRHEVIDSTPTLQDWPTFSLAYGEQ